MNELSDLSTADNTVRVDVWVYCYWIEPTRVWKKGGQLTADDIAALEWKPDLEFDGALDLNPQGTPEDCYYVRDRYRPYGIVSYFQRFTGVIRVDLDLHAFPFDAQLLRIRVGSVQWGTDDCVLVYNRELASSLFESKRAVSHLHEWEVIGKPRYREVAEWNESDQVSLGSRCVPHSLFRST